MLPASTHEDPWFSENCYIHEPVLRTWLCCRYPGLKEEVSDILQEVFIKALRVYQKNGIDSPKPYLFRLTRNLATDYLRRKKVIEFKVLEEKEESFVVDSQTDILDHLNKHQELELLNKAIKALPPKCRQVITLRKVEGLSHKEICNQLGINANTVETQISVGTRKLKQFFEKYRKEYTV